MTDRDMVKLLRDYAEELTNIYIPPSIATTDEPIITGIYNTLYRQWERFNTSGNEFYAEKLYKVAKSTDPVSYFHSIEVVRTILQVIDNNIINQNSKLIATTLTLLQRTLFQLAGELRNIADGLEKKRG